MGTGWSQEEEVSASQSQLRPPNKEEKRNTIDASRHTKKTEAKPEIEDMVETRQQVKAEAKSSNLLDTKGEAGVRMKLPYNYELILRDADSLIDTSSPDKLYEQLCHGVFLNQKQKKYWVDKESACNCFMLYARDFRITWTEDHRLWSWLHVNETRDITVDVPELQNVCWLEVYGKFDTRKLSPRILYEVVMVVMLKDPGYGWDVPINLRLTLPNGTKQEWKENMMVKPRGIWIEIPLGEFRTLEENIGEVEIYVYEYEAGKWKRGLLFKGVVIRPKN